jgi:hypothetical protein
MMCEWLIEKDVEGNSHGLRYYPSIFLEGLRITMKNLSQDNQSPGWDMNPGPTE